MNICETQILKVLYRCYEEGMIDKLHGLLATKSPEIVGFSAPIEFSSSQEEYVNTVYSELKAVAKKEEINDFMFIETEKTATGRRKIEVSGVYQAEQIVW